MHIYYNDELRSEAVLPLSSQGFQYGYGVFETILVEDGMPCFINEHYSRLMKSCNKLSLELKLSEDKLYTQALRLAEAEQLKQGRLKLICFRDEGKDSYVMTLQPYYIDDSYEKKGLALAVSEVRRNPQSPTCFIKSLNYLDNILAKNEAMRKGCDEALLLNVHNKISEGAVSNIFWIKEGIVYTPSIDCGLLEGITRRKVLDICEDLKLRYMEGCYELQELLHADEVFITNSLKGVAPVFKVDNKHYNMDEYNITKQLIKEYKKIVKAL